MSNPVSRSAFPTRLFTVSGVCSVWGTACLSYQVCVFVSRLSLWPLAVSQPRHDRFRLFPKALRYHSTAPKHRSSPFQKKIRSFSRLVDQQADIPHHLVENPCLHPFPRLQTSGCRFWGPMPCRRDDGIFTLDQVRRWLPLSLAAARKMHLAARTRDFPPRTRHPSACVLP
jgi:hypothetical protein